MESAALATDNLRNTMATVDAMRVANKELRKQYGKIDIDKIEVSVGTHVSMAKDCNMNTEHTLRNGRSVGTNK